MRADEALEESIRWATGEKSFSNAFQHLSHYGNVVDVGLKIQALYQAQATMWAQISIALRDRENQ